MIKIQKKVLPINHPEITSYSCLANFFSILNKNIKNNTWFYNYFIPLSLQKRPNYTLLNFNACIFKSIYLTGCDPIYCNRIPYDIINSTWDNFIDFVIYSINQGYYLYFYIDTFFVKAYNNHVHFAHDIMIYGYDKDAEKIYIADFFEGKYSFQKASFSEIESGYRSKYARSFDFLGVYLIKEASILNFIDIDIIKDSIHKHLMSEDCNINPYTIGNIEYVQIEHIFGLSVYDEIITQLKEKNPLIFDIRAFHLNYDHKNIIVSLIKLLFYSEKLKNANDNYRNAILLKEKALMTRNLMIKYILIKNDEIINRIIQLMNEIKNDEKLLLENLYNDICEISDYPIIPYDIEVVYNSIYLQRTSKNGECDSVEFIFFGSEVYYYAFKNNRLGNIDIFIDNVYMSSADLYSQYNIEKDLIYSNNELDIGYHTIKILPSYTDSVIKKCVSIHSFKFITGKNNDHMKNYFSFLGIDTKISGNWKTHYGKKGYDIYGYDSTLPLNISIKYTNCFYIYTQKSEYDDKFLSEPYTYNPLIFYSIIDGIFPASDGIDIDVIVAGDQIRKISLYFLDYNCENKRYKISVYDKMNSGLIFEYLLTDFEKGVYVNFKIRGHIIINICSAEDNCEVLGIFID